MGEENKRFQEMGLEKLDEYCNQSMESSSINDSMESSFSLSSELADDAESSSSLVSLNELAELMSRIRLPIKRGLSKYYHGKSQTFGSLASVKSLEDLAKKDTCYCKRMKSCKSYGGNLNRHKFGPKPTITKKSPKTSFPPTLRSKGGLIMAINCRN